MANNISCNDYDDYDDNNNNDGDEYDVIDSSGGGGNGYTLLVDRVVGYVTLEVMPLSCISLFYFYSVCGHEFCVSTELTFMTSIKDTSILIKSLQNRLYFHRHHQWKLDKETKRKRNHLS